MPKALAFKTLWSAHTITVVGTNTSLIVIPLLAIEVVNASVFQMSILEATESLAVLFLGLFIGILADLLGGHKSILVANTIRGISLLSIPIGYFYFSLTFIQVFIVVFLIGLGTLLYESAISKLIVTEIPENQWTRVNAYMEGSSSVTEVAGPGLGGLLVQFITAPLAVIFDSLCYFIGAIILIFRNKSIVVKSTEAKVNPPENLRMEYCTFLVGVKHIFEQKVLKSITLSAAHFNIFTAMYYGVYTFFLVHTLDFTPLVVGLSSVAAGLGGILATLTVERATKRFSTAVLFIASLTIPGIVSLLVPFSGTINEISIVFALVAFSQFAWSYSIVINLVMSETIKQTLTNSEMIGKVSSSIRWITLGFEPIGAIIGGILATWLGTSFVLYASSIGLITSIVWLIPKNGIRSFDMRM